MQTSRQRNYRRGSIHKAEQPFGDGWLGELYRDSKKGHNSIWVLGASQAWKSGAAFRYHFFSSRAKQTTLPSQKSLRKSVKSFVQVQAQVSGKMVADQVTSVARLPVALKAPLAKIHLARDSIIAQQVPRRLSSSRTRRLPQKASGWHQHIPNDRGC